MWKNLVTPGYSENDAKTKPTLHKRLAREKRMRLKCAKLRKKPARYYSDLDKNGEDVLQRAVSLMEERELYDTYRRASFQMCSQRLAALIDCCPPESLMRRKDDLSQLSSSSEDGGGASSNNENVARSQLHGSQTSTSNTPSSFSASNNLSSSSTSSYPHLLLWNGLPNEHLRQNLRVSEYRYVGATVLHRLLKLGRRHDRPGKGKSHLEYYAYHASVSRSKTCAVLVDAILTKCPAAAAVRDTRTGNTALHLLVSTSGDFVFSSLEDNVWCGLWSRVVSKAVLLVPSAAAIANYRRETPGEMLASRFRDMGWDRLVFVANSTDNTIHSDRSKIIDAKKVSCTKISSDRVTRENVMCKGRLICKNCNRASSTNPENLFAEDDDEIGSSYFHYCGEQQPKYDTDSPAAALLRMVDGKGNVPLHFAAKSLSRLGSWRARFVTNDVRAMVACYPPALLLRNFHGVTPLEALVNFAMRGTNTGRIERRLLSIDSIERPVNNAAEDEFADAAFECMVAMVRPLRLRGGVVTFPPEKKGSFRLMTQWSLVHGCLGLGGEHGGILCPPLLAKLAVKAYPWAARLPDAHGNYPLHLALMNEMLVSRRAIYGYGSEDRNVRRSIRWSSAEDSIIVTLLEQNPCVARVPNANGHLPIHLAIEAAVPWDCGVKQLLAAFSESIYTKGRKEKGSTRENLFPVQQAAMLGKDSDLDTVFQLLRANPVVLIGT